MAPTLAGVRGLFLFLPALARTLQHANIMPTDLFNSASLCGQTRRAINARGVGINFAICKLAAKLRKARELERWQAGLAAMGVKRLVQVDAITKGNRQASHRISLESQ